MNFLNEANKIESFLCETRHDFHMYPELPMQEVRTSRKVREFLQEEEIEILPLETPTSVAAIIRGAYKGATVALRTELDALPIAEENNLSYKSVHDGVMHACGHDVHLTCLMGAAKILKEHAAEMHGNVILLFQAAEENATGAKQMIHAGVMDYAMDAIFGLHTNTSIDAGEVAFLPGVAQASADMFFIEIHGQGGHGAFPHTTIDPVMIASQLVTQLQSVVSRNMDPVKTGVLSICQINSGTSPNIIPQSASLSGTIRALEPEARELIITRLQSICKSIEVAYGCKCEFRLQEGTPALINHLELTELAQESCRAVLGQEHVKPLSVAMVGDDMAEFLTRVPGVLGALGVRNEKKGIIHGNHTPQFQVDETCLCVGTACMAQMAWDYLEKRA